MHGHAVALSTCDQNHHVSFRPLLSDRLSRRQRCERLPSPRTRHFSANACLLPICQLHGAAVTTVEGIGSTKTRIHPVQVRWPRRWSVDADASRSRSSPHLHVCRSG